MRKLLVLILVLTIPGFLVAQNAGPASGSGFQAGMNLGSDLLPTGPGGAMESWTRLGFEPDLALGKFGVGLDLTLRFKLYPSDSSAPFEIYPGDWIPSGSKTFLDLYLPKLMYVRYGLRGLDPMYAKLGSISDFTLGNGFIVDGYANTRFLPDLRLIGLQAGLDGRAFDFPYIGIEALTGNLAKLDVVGGRLFLRPLAFLGVPVLKSLQLGATGVMDLDPYLYDLPSTTGTEGVDFQTREAVYVFGADLTAPIISSGLFTMTAFVDGAYQPSGAMGASAGLGGRILGIFTYKAQGRYLQEGFVPSYFDANYDLYRAVRFDQMMKTDPGAFIPGWLGNLGFSILKDKLSFSATLDAPFTWTSDPTAGYPHLKGKLKLADGVIGGISFEAGYEKFYLGQSGDFFGDLVNPEDAIIGLAVNYKTGATLLTLNYVYSWNPTISDFEVSSSLTASVKF
jgi:hypothetical protein